MTTTLAPFPKFRAFTAAGLPLVGGLLYTYAAGTTTPLATYTDYGGGTPNANPVVLDGNGEANVWLGSSPYKFVLKSSTGVTQWTVDNIYADPSSTVLASLASTSSPTAGDYLIGVKKTVSGASATTQHKVNEYRVINPVVDFACPTDGVTDCSAAVTNAITALGTAGTLEFPKGTYLMNIDVGAVKVNIKGDGIGSTILKSYSPTGDVVTIGPNASWDNMVIENLTICGPSATITANGIKFGHSAYQTDDEFAGRVIIRNCKFVDLDKCVSRLYGNIGLWIQNSTFESANYHVYTVGQTSPIMHGGAMIVKDTHFQLSEKASCYIDSPQTGTGMVVFDNCTHEYNKGFVHYIKSFNSVSPAPGYIVRNCWSEGNYTAASVVIGGTTYTPPKYAYISDATSVDFYQTPVGPMAIVSGSTVKVTGTNVDHTTTGSGIPNAADSTIDSSSVLIFEDTEQDLSVSMAYNRSPIISYRNGAMSAVRHRSWVGGVFNSSAVAVGKNDCTLPITFAGTGAGTTTTVLSDGTLFDACQELTLSSTAGQTHLDTNAADYITVTSGNYQVYCVTYKLMSGAFPTIQWGGGVGLSGVFRTSSGWVTVMGIAKSGSSAPCYLEITSAGTGVIRLGGYFIAEFATRQKALEFLESGCFPAIGAGSTVANGTVMNELGSLGPTGSQTTIQGWQKINVGGVARYVPFW